MLSFVEVTEVEEFFHNLLGTLKLLGAIYWRGVNKAEHRPMPL